MLQKPYDVIIVGGSYAGLSAAMTLGRSLKQVLVIDSGLPCNRNAPHSHNFITQDGETPTAITAKAKQQVLTYQNVEFINGRAIHAAKQADHFVIQTDSGTPIETKKILFTTGVIDVLPEISGFEVGWGISIIHCPYCHGYEVKGEKTGVLGNGDLGFEYVKMISNWTKNLSLFTHGPSVLTKEQTQIIEAHQIRIVEAPIHLIVQEAGYINCLILEDGSSHPLSVLYAKTPFRQHCGLPLQLGCEMTQEGFIMVDDFQRTTVPGIYAAGDNTTPFRSVAAAVAAGSKAGAFINKALIDENF
jgi:thioredoxin reductase